MTDRPYLPYSAPSTQDDTHQFISTMDTVSRLHRGSSVQRPAGAMRVVKPSSTSNSPQARAARRRTMMADTTNIARRRGQQLDHNTIQQHFHQSPCFTTSAEEPVKRSSRPFSWHPSSNPQAYFQQQQFIANIQHQLEHQSGVQQNSTYQNGYAQYVPAYTLPTPAAYADDELHHRFQYIPPTPIQLSAQNSPISSYAPSILPSGHTTQQFTESPPHYFAPATWNQNQQYDSSMSYGASPEALEAFPPLPVSSASSWEQSDRPVDFYGGVTPPTPQDTQPSQHHEAVAVTSEDSIPYEPLETPEDEGEILVGMGLYEDPEKVDDDCWLGNYRKTTSELLGTTYRRIGQGLKLEESWEPPASDDENDGDDSSSDRDADGEEQDTIDSPEDTQAWI